MTNLKLDIGLVGSIVGEAKFHFKLFLMYIGMQ